MYIIVKPNSNDWQQGISKLEWHEKRGSIAALSSLALFHNEDVFTTLPGSRLYSIKFSIFYQLAPSPIMTFMLTIISQWKWSSTLNVCACAVNTWTTYRYIHIYIHTYIHKYSDFLVAMISVGLAQARPNNIILLCYNIIIVIIDDACMDLILLINYREVPFKFS